MPGIPLWKKAFEQDKTTQKEGFPFTITTDANGFAASGLRDAGEYWVIETGVSAEDQTEYGKASYQPFAVTVEAGEVNRTEQNTKEVVNTSNLGKFTVTKIDAYDKEELPGAVLEIWTTGADGSKVPVTDGSGKTLTMADNGDGTYTSPFLAPGQYLLKETKAPEGYYLPDGGILFENIYAVTANSLTATDAGKNPLTLENDLANSLTVLKYEKRGDQETATLITTSPATFALYTNEDAAKAASVDDPEDPFKIGDTGTAGKITWTGLPNDTYYLKELSGPAGYVADTDRIYEITLNNETADRTVAYEQPVYNLLLGGFELDKVVKWDTAEGGYVAGEKITFDLYAGTKVAEGAEPLATLTTDKKRPDLLPDGGGRLRAGGADDGGIRP